MSKMKGPIETWVMLSSELHVDKLAVCLIERQACRIGPTVLLVHSYKLNEEYLPSSVFVPYLAKSTGQHKENRDLNISNGSRRFRSIDMSMVLLLASFPQDQ
jgi:hypothetical protein